MKLYDQIFDVVKQFKKLFSPGPVTNADVSGSITAEIFLIVSLVLSAILLRHVNVLLAGLVTFILAIVLISNIPLIFSVTLFDSVFHLSNMINPGVSNIYNALGTQIAPNLVTVVIFDFRAYDTLGESIILLTAGLVVLLIFGRGLLGDKQ